MEWMASLRIGFTFWRTVPFGVPIDLLYVSTTHGGELCIIFRIISCGEPVNSNFGMLAQEK